MSPINSTIPFHRSDIGEQEIEAVVNALRAGHLTGDGPETKRVQLMMQEMFSAKHILLTPSCTHAMELALMAAGIGPGDEVILPSFTFTSTANAVVLQGARPIFAEIELPTLTLAPKDVERRITTRTKAIIPVHYAGVSARMDEIMALADRYSLLVIEDAAQGVGAKYRGRYLGTIGHMGAYSFHGTKNFTCGEGGAFITSDDDLFYRAEIIREKGTNRQAFLRGEVDKYTWVDRGSSYLLADLLAALLDVQLSRLDELISARRAIHDRYQEAFKSFSADGIISQPYIPDGYESNYHLYYVLARSLEERNHLLDGLKANGIGAAFHYIPLHSSPVGRQLLGWEEELPITEHISKTLVRLPIYPSMKQGEMEKVITAVKAIINGDGRSV